MLDKTATHGTHQTNGAKCNLQVDNKPVYQKELNEKVCRSEKSTNKGKLLCFGKFQLIRGERQVQWHFWSYTKKRCYTQKPVYIIWAIEMATLHKQLQNKSTR